MRGQEPVVVCQFDRDGEEIREILLAAFRRFVERELEQETVPESEAKPCP